MLATLALVITGWNSGWFLLLRVKSLPSSPSMPAEQCPEGMLISVIIPARNEAANITRLLKSLANQTIQPFEIIVVDDSSQDDTATLASRAGARVIAAGNLPANWHGKSWACWSGARAAAGELLLFLDADTVLEPEALSRLISASITNGGIISVQPYHRTEKLYESLSSFFNIIVLAAVGEGDMRSGAFGPCIVCRRDDYFRLGGHEVVRGKVLDNYELGLLFSQSGSPITNYVGTGAVSFRMYPEGLGSLIAGWSKSFAAGAAATPILVLAAVVLWLSSAGASIHLWLGISMNPSLADIAVCTIIYCAYVLQMFIWQRRIGNFSFLAALFYPLSLLTFFLVFTYSLYCTYIRGQVQWKGRSLSTNKGDQP